ncbi:MAG: hypothetical protein ACREDX_07420 [Aestuariivirga sp.]
MTMIVRTSFITIASTATLASIALFSQAASASTNNLQCSSPNRAQAVNCCARLTSMDVTGCREVFIRMKRQRLLIALVKESDGGGGGNGGHGGRK